jgi:hypothetical protein
MQQACTVVFGNITGGCVWAGAESRSRNILSDFKRTSRTSFSLSEIHLEDRQGTSEMVAHISRALHLPYTACFAQSPSHLDTRKLAGLAVLSRFPLLSQEIFLLPNPQQACTGSCH